MPTDLDERIRSRRVAEAHFDYELSNDADTILKSMKSYDPLFTTVVIGEGTGTPRLVRSATIDEQRNFYATARARGHIVEVDIFTSVGSDWYGFVHGIATGRSLETSEESQSELIGLLPSTPDEDTISGEIGLSWPLTLGKRGDEPGKLAHERVATKRVHEAWLDAFGSGDAGRLADLYAETAAFAMRHPVTGEITAVNGRDAIRAAYQELFAEVEVLGSDLVLRIVDRWFAFSELALRVRHAREGELRASIAEICVVGNDDKIIVHLGSAPSPTRV